MNNFMRICSAILGVSMVFSICSCDKSNVKTEESKDRIKETEPDDDHDDYQKEEDSQVSQVSQDAQITLGPLLGFTNCYCTGEFGDYDYGTWSFYNENDELIAMQFAFGAADGPCYYLRDLDGDGSEEMICECIYNADGAQRVFIYRNNNGVVEVGVFDEDRMSEELGEDLCVRSYDMYYDRAKNQIIYFDNFGEQEYEVDYSYFLYHDFDPNNTF